MKPYIPEVETPREPRAIVAVLVTIGAVILLGAFFFTTQIVQNDDYVLQAEDNRMAVIPVPAPRGRILDRHGEVIASTQASRALLLGPASLDSIRVALALLQPTLELSSGRVEQLTNQYRLAPGRPLLVATNLTDEQYAGVAERRAQLPRISVEQRLVRSYPQGEAVAHLVGYVGEVEAAELADTIRLAGYRVGQEIGKTGLERQYEDLLAGVPGERYAEVDADGNHVGNLAPREAVPPTPGEDLRLSIDLGLQTFLDSVFPSEHNGAVVAIEPGTGEVLALYSHPTFDPNPLAVGLAAATRAQLTDDPRQPLVNRAISGIYPAGAAGKLTTAIIGLERGVIQTDSRMPIPCSGGISYAGRYSRCWNSRGHGALDLTEALDASCDVYFYQLGIWLGLNQLTREGTRLGFTRPTGIDLPDEGVGIFPDGEAWYERQLGTPAEPDEVMGLAAGHDANVQSPLRVAQVVAALAGNGRAAVPRLNPRAPRGAPETDLGLETDQLAAFRSGLVSAAEGGESSTPASDRWVFHGTTGTAPNSSDSDEPHAWFAGFAGPDDMDAEIAIVVVIEAGGSRGEGAAELATRAADFYLDRKHRPGGSGQAGETLATAASP